MNITALLKALPKSEAYVHSTATDPLQQFMFSVKFYNFSKDGKISSSKAENTKIGFQKVSGLSADLNGVEYHEGCTNYPVKLAGKASFGEVTMEKGVVPSTSSSLSTTKNVLDLLAETCSDSTSRMDVDVNVLGREGKVRIKYILNNAFMSKWEAPDLDASSDDVAIEKITLQYDYLTYEIPKDETGSFENWSPSGLIKSE